MAGHLFVDRKDSNQPHTRTGTLVLIAVPDATHAYLQELCDYLINVVDAHAGVLAAEVRYSFCRRALRTSHSLHWPAHATPF